MNGIHKLDPEKTLAILIGLEKYAGFADIAPAPNNVTELAKILQDENIFGIPLKQIKQITQGTNDVIEEEIEEFIKDAKKRGFKTLILYYSGHGYRRAGKQYFLCANNSKPQRIEKSGTTAIPFEAIKNSIAESRIPQSIVLLDACYSGLEAMGKADSIASIDLKGSYTITSSDSTELAYFDRNHSHTLFTGVLLDILKNGLELDDEHIPLDQLYLALADKVTKKNPGMRPQQKASKEITGSNYLFFKNRQFDQEARHRKEIEALILVGDECLGRREFDRAELQYYKAKHQAERFGLVGHYEATFKSKFEFLRTAEKMADEWKMKPRKRKPTNRRNPSRRRKLFFLFLRKNGWKIGVVAVGMLLIGWMAISFSGMGNRGTETLENSAVSDTIPVEVDTLPIIAGRTSSVSILERDSAESKTGRILATIQAEEKAIIEEPDVKVVKKAIKPVESKPSEKKESHPANEKTKEDEIIARLERNMVTVTKGSFKMGCTSEQKDCNGDEKPPHEVTLSGFKINKYEVTQEEWYAVMESYPEKLGFKGCDKCPVEGVSWNDIQDFLKKLNQKSKGKGYRLPTEAEWEYAARGGQKKTKDWLYSGSDVLSSVGWYDRIAESKTHPVGGKDANELGLYDMSGNVWEMCQDHWHDAYEGAPSDGYAWEEKTGEPRVIRGGSWNSFAQYCRVAYRGNWHPDYRLINVGFRLAHSL